MKVVIIIIVIAIAVLLLVRVIGHVKMKDLPLVADNTSIITLTDENFGQATKGKVMLVDFWAAWCPPCRAMAPVLNELAGELDGNMQIGKVNIDQYPSIAEQYNVRSIPTFILFKDGKEMKRYVGLKQKNFLLQEMKKASGKALKP